MMEKNKCECVCVCCGRGFGVCGERLRAVMVNEGSEKGFAQPLLHW